MREYEIKAAQSISNFIAARESPKTVSWYPGEDPPDAYIKMDNKLLPLEITSTEVFRDPLWGQEKVLERTYEISHRDMVKEIEREAIEQEKLRGKYVITFSKPLSSKDFSTYKSVFKSLLIELLNASKISPAAFEQNVVLDDVVLASVYKSSEEGGRLYEAFEDGAWTESTEFIEFVQSVIRKAVEIKVEKLSPKVDLSESLLAIVNTYGLADDRAMKSAYEDLEGLSRFHSVFILNGNQIMVPHSVEHKWRNAA
jgi:hypothetical protein